MGIHDGHREKKRQQFLQHGLDAFADHEVLELLLFYAIPRKDTNPIAHQLMDHFGSLDRVLSASVEELCQVEGIGPSAALLITLLPQISRRAALQSMEREVILNSVEAMGRYCLTLAGNSREEEFYLICLDAKGKVTGRSRLGDGAAAVSVNLRKVAELVLRHNAYAVVLTHNHPSGMALPSRDDLLATQQIEQLLRNMGVMLLDHIITADGDFVSMAANGSIPHR